MRIDKEKCVGCGECLPYCPVKAITLKRRKGRLTEDEQSRDFAEIDFDECVECSNCLRFADCPTGAIYQKELVWPRIVRNVLSDVPSRGRASCLPGKAREGMKTNDVTGIFKRGYAGVAMEFGRPILGVRLYDVEKVAQALAALGVEFEKLAPVTGLMEDPRTGKFKEDVINEKALSVVLELTVKLDRLPELLASVKKVSREIETVFSFSLITRANRDGSIPTEPILKEAGFWAAPNGKTCVGLGRPLAKED
jgi:NAD-dependent dihydropyrimidine dehydrogenase PreA subunit